jgi:hypothetical protein
MKKPNIDMYAGIKVNKDTELTFENENVKQELKDLVLHTEMTIKGEGYESTQNTKVFLQEGDVLLFEDEDRGYIKPVETFMTVAEAIEELSCIKEV